MKRAFVTSSFFLFASLVIFAGCRSGGGDLTQAQTQRRFGVRMAKMNLWREAMFRFRRATEIEPDNAMAHNNLAVAYEATGNYDAALREYREALRLDRSNEYIQKNYSRFVEFSQRSRKRAGPPAAATATAAAATTPGAPASEPADATGTPAPAPPPTAAQPAVTPPPQQPVPPPQPVTDTATTNPPAESAR